MVSPVPIMPVVKKMADISDDKWIFSSTSLPAKAADIPRKNIARLKAQPTEKPSIPMVCAIDSLKVEKQ
jgi:hypothetical protein